MNVYVYVIFICICMCIYVPVSERYLDVFVCVDVHL